jgi:sulfotransferase family protein
VPFVPAPACPPGWVTGPPDFVGVGAQRSGTTRWYDLVCSHPAIQPAAAVRKELHFFDELWSAPLRREVSEYARWFPREPGLLTGEWTGRYMHDFWTPPLLAEAAPRAKLLVSLRDPVERYRSGIERLHRRAAEGETVTADAANDQAARSAYGDQLRRLRRWFPAEQILVLQYERCVADPAAELARTFRFLGVDPGFTPSTFDVVRNQGGPKEPLDPRTHDALMRFLTPQVRRLARLVPDLDLGLWPSFRHLASSSSTLAGE